MSDGDAQARAGSGEIARRALRTLAERHVVPTPETFAEAYFEVAGERGAAGSAVALVHDLLRDLQGQQRLTAPQAGAFADLAARHQWPALRAALDQALARGTGTGASWPALTLAALKQVDVLHAHWTRGRKLDAVARVIDAATDAETARERLQRLIESWGTELAPRPKPPLDEREPLERLTQPLPPDFPGPMPAAQRYAADPDELRALQANAAKAARAAEAWQQVAVRAMHVLERSLSEGSPARARLHEYAQQQARALAPGQGRGQAPGQGRGQADEEVATLVPRFVDLAAAIDRQVDEEHRVKAGLQRLLALLCDNLKSLSPDEAWLAGQLEPIRALLAGPLRSQQLAEAEERLAQIIGQQALARRSLHEAKVALKEMLATLIERIGGMGRTTGRFCDQVGAYQAELEQATDFDTLARVIRGLLADTQIVRADMQRSHEELLAARRKVETYEQRVRQLEQELVAVSTLVQRDPLTHALNRRGLAEAFRIETARALRHRSPLALAVIDVDDFKTVNDRLGHLAGDRALVHLLTVLQVALRPTDVVARIGGEEFALLFAATGVDEAVAATVRVQAELAARVFEHEGDTHPLSFSAGVAAWSAGETLEQVLARADQAMYRAKRAGKNRVERA